MPFVWFARFDSADLHLLAWSTMTVAAGLWAMRPMRPMSWLGRRVTGWFLAGIALAAAALSKGPIALVYTVVPLAGAIAVTRTRRLSNIMGLLFSILLGVLIALLWYLHVAEQHKDAVERWFNAWTGADLPPQPAVYYLLILLVVFPWTVTIVGSLAQPFLQASGEFRRRLLIGWVWFVALGVILSIPVAKDLRLALPLMPAVGLLVAQIWSHHGNLAGEGIPDPGINLIRVPHWLGLIVASIALPVFIVLQSDFVESGRITQPLLAGINTPVAATLLAVLLIITLVGAVSHWRWKPGTAFLATFIWMIVALTVIAFGHSRNHTGPTHAAVTASGMLDVVGHKPVYRLIETDPNDDAINDDPSTALLFYYGRPIIPSTLGTLTRRADQPCYVLVARDQPGADTLLDADYTLVARIDDRDGYALYSSPGATRQTTETQP